MPYIYKIPTEHDATPLAVAEVLHGAYLLASAEAVAADDASHLLLLLDVGKLFGHVVHGGQVEVDLLGEVLMVAADLEMRVAAYLALGGQELAVDELEERGLAGAVGSDEGDARVQIDAEVERLVDGLGVVLVLEGDLLHAEHGRRYLAAVGKRERERLVGDDALGEAAVDHLAQRLLLGLRLARQLGRAVTEARDVVLHVGDLVLLPLVALGLVGLELDARLNVRVVVAREVLERLLGQVDDVGADAVEEVLRVRDEHERALVVLQLLLEPHGRLEVQVVGRLVEQQQRRTEIEGARERDAHAPAAAEVAALLLLHLAGEAEAEQDARRLDLAQVRVELVEALVDLADLLLRLHVVELGEALGLALQLLDLLVGLEHRLERRLVGRRDLARQVVHVDVVGHGHLAVRYGRQYGRLARAVEADDAVAAAVVELQLGVDEQLLAVEGQRELMDVHVAAVRVRRQHACARAILGVGLREERDRLHLALDLVKCHHVGRRRAHARQLAHQARRARHRGQRGRRRARGRGGGRARRRRLGVDAAAAACVAVAAL